MRNENIVSETDRFLRMPEVREATGLSRPQIYLLISKGEFPKQIKLGEKASAWLQSEIRSWMQSRIVHSRSLGEQSDAKSEGA